MASPVKVGQKVHIRERKVDGEIAYIGATDFAPGKWVGIILTEPKGKNDGSVQGKSYFKCTDKHGMFVRQNQLDQVADILPDTGEAAKAKSPAKGTSPKSPSDGAAKKPGGIPTPGGAKGGSRLPAPGTGPTGGRSPSFTNLKLKERSGIQQPQSGLTRERSFVEKNFVETLKQPQVSVTPQTPKVASAAAAAAQRPMGSSPASGSAASPSSAAATQMMAERLEEKAANLAISQELQRTKEEVIDLKEKLETIKVKRAKDQEKIKEFEKLRIQHEQLLEFKSRIMESQGALQKELQKARHEAKEAIEAKEAHAEEMTELAETVEMATLDKEMAEERAETLQIELDAAKEKVEELTLDLDIIKTEMGDEEGNVTSSSGGVTNFEVKHLAAQNEKLKDTLVRMRDLSAHEKSENIKLTKDLEELKTRVTELTKQNEKYSKENDSLEATISELQEQVDAALGAEEMVENLTTKCLDLEDKYAAVMEDKSDLEKLHEMDEELQENARELEMELREDIDLAHGKIREIERSREVAFEVIADHEATIGKFRGLVQKLQDQNADLRSEIAKGPTAGGGSGPSTNVSSDISEVIDFKKMLADTKAYSKAIDMELRQCEVDQASLHVRYLKSYMTDSFTSRGGDNDAVEVLLLIPRMSKKVEILVNQIKDKFVPVDVDKAGGALKGHDAERLTFGLHMMIKLNGLSTILNKFEAALQSCSPATFLLIGTLYQEMSVHERAVDFYIELLRKDQLDENVPFETIEKCIAYFQQIYPLHLGGEAIEHAEVLSDHLKTFQAASDCLSQLTSIVRASKATEEASEMAILLKTTDSGATELKQLVKSMKRRLPPTRKGATVSPTDPVIKFDSTINEQLEACAKESNLMVKAFYIFSRSVLQQAGLDPEAKVEIPPAKLAELLHHAVDRVYEFTEGAGGPEVVRSTLSKLVASLTGFDKALQEGEWDSTRQEVTAPPQPPVALRADKFKAEIKEAETMKYKLENKDMDIKELKKIMKAKTDEMSEMQVRKDKAEKRLNDANKEADLMREKLQRKLEDSQATLKRKEKEFEDTMEHLQRDLDSLESERGELKNKLKETTMKVLLEGIARGSPSASPSLSSVSTAGPISIGPSIPAPVKDSPMLVRQLQDLQLALAALKEESYRRKGEEMRQRLLKMKPLTVPSMARIQNKVAEDKKEKADASKEDVPSMSELSHKVQALQARIKDALAKKEVVDLGNKSKTASETNALEKLELRRETDRLRLEIARLVASRKPGGIVQADFTQFPTPQMAKSLAEKDYSVVGRLRPSLCSRPATGVELKTVPLIVGPKDLSQIHRAVLA